MIPLRDSTPSSTFPSVTLSIIALNLVVFFFQLTFGYEAMDLIVEQWGLIPSSFNNLAKNQNGMLPLITYMFLHGGWMHVIGNMWSLWLFGDNLEDKMGKVRFVLFYLVCGLCAALIHCLMFPSSSIPVVGASGAIAGVMGAYFMMFRKARVLTFIPPFFILPLPAWIFLGFWALSQLWGGAFSLLGGEGYSSIAFWAHIGGFITGMLAYRLFLKPEARIEFIP